MTVADGADRARWPLLLIGVGLGGFVDGIVLHQILQWHHMVSNVDRYPTGTVDGLEANTLGDGLFHAATWVFVVVGLLWLVRLPAGTRSLPVRGVVGWLAVGWGIFNLVEGVVDHHLLGLHHVREDVADPLPWDLGFLALGLALVLGGLALTRRAEREPGP